MPFQGPYSGPLPAAPHPMGQRAHKAKGTCAPESMQPLLKPTLGTQDTRNPAQMSPRVGHITICKCDRETTHVWLGGTPTCVQCPSQCRMEPTWENKRVSPCKLSPVTMFCHRTLRSCRIQTWPPKLLKSIFGINYCPLLLDIRNPAFSLLPFSFSSAYSCLTTNHISQPPLQLDERGD